jgi:DNA-binding FrmR family transcriptional regulator
MAPCSSMCGPTRNGMPDTRRREGRHTKRQGRGGHLMQDQQAQRKILNRLKRAQGQLNAVVASFERGEGCRDTVTQLAAVTAALDRAGFAIIASAMQECIDQRESPAASTTHSDDALTIEQLEKLFLSLA